MENYNLKFTYRNKYPCSSDHEFNEAHSGMKCRILTEIPIEYGMARVEFEDGTEGDAELGELEEI